MLMHRVFLSKLFVILEELHDFSRRPGRIDVAAGMDESGH